MSKDSSLAIQSHNRIAMWSSEPTASRAVPVLTRYNPLRLADARLLDAGASLEQKKRSYSQDLYKYTKTMFAEVTKAVG